eukprot:11201357-Karenia_brevis.AAC.1
MAVRNAVPWGAMVKPQDGVLAATEPTEHKLHTLNTEQQHNSETAILAHTTSSTISPQHHSSPSTFHPHSHFGLSLIHI